MMWRNELEIGYKQPISNPCTTDITKDLIGWLEAQPAPGPTGWLLAHAENGVIWGRVADGKLKLATGINQSAPVLCLDTLIEARLFGERAEVRLWRANNGWRACCLEDQVGAGDSFDEFHRLWGIRSNGSQDGFTVLHEPGVGVTHTVPIPVTEDAFAPAHSGFDTYRPLLLTCRHYLDYDQKTGEARIAATRLVNLQVEAYSEYNNRRKS